MIVLHQIGFPEKKYYKKLSKALAKPKQIKNQKKQNE